MCFTFQKLWCTVVPKMWLKWITTVPVGSNWKKWLEQVTKVMIDSLLKLNLKRFHTPCRRAGFRIYFGEGWDRQFSTFCRWKRNTGINKCHHHRKQANKQTYIKQIYKVIHKLCKTSNRVTRGCTEILYYLPQPICIFSFKLAKLKQ